MFEISLRFDMSVHVNRLRYACTLYLGHLTIFQQVANFCFCTCFQPCLRDVYKVSRGYPRILLFAFYILYVSFTSMILANSERDEVWHLKQCVILFIFDAFISQIM